MTLKEHNRHCGCTPQEPCATLAAILRDQHVDVLVEVADPRRSRTPSRA